MSRRVKAAVVVTAVLTLAIGGIAARAGSTPIDWKAAGTIANVQLAIPPFFEPVPGFLIHAAVAGAPGAAEFTVVTVPGSPSDQCGDNFGQSVLQNDMVITFPDQSMIFAKLNPAAGKGAWICFTGPDTVAAVANMTITGGTGRFEGAEGNFVGKFVGRQVGASGALAAETGTIEGSIERIAQ